MYILMKLKIIVKIGQYSHIWKSRFLEYVLVTK